MAPKDRKKAKRKSAKAKASRAASRNGGGRRELPAGPSDELLAMDQAIALLKTTRPTFYRWLRSGKIKGMKVGRQWRFYREDLERFLKGQGPRIDLPADIDPLMRGLEAKLKQLGVAETVEPEENKVACAVKLMIMLGTAKRASDIHLASYYRKEMGAPVAELRYRVDGVLHREIEIDARLLPGIVAQWKSMATCNLHETGLPQDGRIMLNVGKAKKRLDLRISFLPTVLGESLTARVLDPEAVCLTLDGIGFSPADRKKLLNALESPCGLVLVSGPTGSGKTTVLYSCLNYVADETRKVMSIEDPVEYLLPNVIQIPVRPEMPFERAMRAVLRSAPDVIMLGELRNAEALNIAMQSALTGHLVMTTLHTEDAAGALRRMVDMGGAPFVVGDATRLVVAQRLVRTLCKACSVEARPAQDLLKRAESLGRLGGIAWDSLPRTFRKPVGCPKCGQTGFRGRNIVAEVIEVTDDIRAALRNGASVDDLRETAIEGGTTTMAADGIRKAAAGETTLKEVFRVLALR